MNAGLFITVFVCFSRDKGLASGNPSAARSREKEHFKHPETFQPRDPETGRSSISKLQKTQNLQISLTGQNGEPISAPYMIRCF